MIRSTCNKTLVYIITWGVGILTCCVPSALAEPVESTYSIVLPAPHRKLGSGILPYFFDEHGKAYFLLGRDQEGTWSDFGGSAEPTDEDTYATAIRKFTEQTRYVFGKLAADMRPLEAPIQSKERKRLAKKSARYIKSRITAEIRHPKNYYVMYLARVDFVPSDAFSSIAVPSYDKTAYAWISVDDFMDVMNSTHNRYRAFYFQKQIKRHLFDMLNNSHTAIMNTIYPERIVSETPPAVHQKMISLPYTCPTAVA